MTNHGAEYKVRCKQEPEQRIEKQDSGFTADHQLQRDKFAQMPWAQISPGMAHIDQVGLHIAFNPARTLADPVLCLWIGLFICNRICADALGADIARDGAYRPGRSAYSL